MAAFYIRAGHYRVKIDCIYPPGTRHPDDGDVHVQHRDHPEWKIVESKSYDYSITEIANWPHIAIGKVDTMDERDWMPDLVFAIASGGSRPLEWAMILKLSDVPAERIEVHKYRDKYSDGLYEMYAVPTRYWKKVFIGAR